MNVVQLVTNLNFGDAIGNDILAIDDTLKEAGYDCRIMAFTIHETLKNRADFVDLSSIEPDDIVLFHKATGDVLLCMSEHEGFCVPLLEAAGSGLPVIAYAKGAVPGTLGDDGLMVYNKDYCEIARLINRVCSDEDFRRGIIEKQKRNLERFTREKTKEKVLELIKEAGA